MESADNIAIRPEDIKEFIGRTFILKVEKQPVSAIFIALPWIYDEVEDMAFVRIAIRCFKFNNSATIGIVIDANL